MHEHEETPLARPATPTARQWQGREPVYASLAPIVDGVTRILFDLEIEGLARLPRRGPALLMANHVSHLDPMVLLSLCRRAGRRRPRFLALADLWRQPGIGWLLRKGHMIPVHRGAGRDAAMHMVEAGRTAMSAGQVVVVYPEGRLPDPRRPQRPARGAGYLALTTCAMDVGAPILPVAMSGVPAWEGRLPRPRTPVQVEVGAPLDLSDLSDLLADVPDGLADDTTAKAASARALTAINEMLARPRNPGEGS